MSKLKTVKSILESGGGRKYKSLKKLLKSSQDNIESFSANVLLPKDKRSINEIIKEDGSSGAAFLNKLVRQADLDRKPSKTLRGKKRKRKEAYESLSDEEKGLVGERPIDQYSKGGMLIEGLKKIAGKDKNKSRPDLESKAKRKKKMDAEKPRSARRDMAKKDTFTGQKYRTGGPEGGMRQMTPQYKAFMKQQAKKEKNKDTLISLGAAGVTGAGATAAMVSAGKKEAERVKKEQERVKKFQDEKLKSKKKVPVKKAQGGIVTKWESKWG